jgi:hypothetical protein
VAAKLIGLLAGVQIQALQQGRIGIVPELCKDSIDQVLARDYVTFNNNVVGDTVSMGLFKSTTFISAASSYYMKDACGVGCTATFGDATYPAALNATISLVAAGSGILITPAPAAQIAAPLWQRLGYAADPGRTIELLMTLGGANPANGTSVAWQLFGRFQ